MVFSIKVEIKVLGLVFLMMHGFNVQLSRAEELQYSFFFLTFKELIIFFSDSTKSLFLISFSVQRSLLALILLPKQQHYIICSFFKDH